MMIQFLDIIINFLHSAPSRPPTILNCSEWSSLSNLSGLIVTWEVSKKNINGNCNIEFLSGNYRIYSIKHPGRLLNFWTLGVGTYSRWVLIRGWALIKCSPFSASSKFILQQNNR